MSADRHFTGCWQVHTQCARALVEFAKPLIEKALNNEFNDDVRAGIAALEWLKMVQTEKKR